MTLAHAASNDNATLGLSVEDIACLEVTVELSDNMKATAILAKHTVDNMQMPVLRK